MSQWPSSKAKQVLAALLRIGWAMKRQDSSHRVLERQGWPDYIYAFHDGEEIGPKMLARIAKRMGLSQRTSEMRRITGTYIVAVEVLSDGISSAPSE